MASAAGPPNEESATFDITSAVNDECIVDTCTATATSPDGNSTVTVTSGVGTTPLTIIFEATPLDCPDFTGTTIGSTITIEPPEGASGSVSVKFEDTVFGFPVGPYQICKTIESGAVTTTQLVPFCADIPDGLDQVDGTEPCITSQTTSAISANQYKLTSNVLITAIDPAFGRAAASQRSKGGVAASADDPSSPHSGDSCDRDVGNRDDPQPREEVVALVKHLLALDDHR